MPSCRRNRDIHLCPWLSPSIFRLLSMPFDLVIKQQFFTGMHYYDHLVVECCAKTTLSDESRDLAVWYCRNSSPCPNHRRTPFAVTTSAVSVYDEVGTLQHGCQTALFPRSDFLAVRQADVEWRPRWRLVQATHSYHVAQRDLRITTKTQDLKIRQMLEDRSCLYPRRLQEQSFQAAPASCGVGYIQFRVILCRTR